MVSRNVASGLCGFCVVSVGVLSPVGVVVVLLWIVTSMVWRKTFLFLRRTRVRKIAA